MAYLVKITSRAERDLDALYDAIHGSDSERAQHWYFGLRAAILNLSVMPNRNPITAENKRLRHLLYGHKPYVYRVIFRVSKKTGCVTVLHVRHGARQKFKKSDLK
jgi:plasmid stabilization system protein ParE